MNNDKEEISNNDQIFTNNLQIIGPKNNSITNITILYPISTISILSEYLNTTKIEYFYNESILLKTPYLIQLNNDDDEKGKKGIIFPVVNNFYGIFNINKNIPKHEGNIIMNIINSTELINKCEKLTLEENNFKSIEFSMKPPSSSLMIKNSDKIEDEEKKSIDDEELIDPIEFLQGRYYSTLYSLKDPLSYFPKTALPRFKNLCFEQNSTIELLKKFCLNINEFDNRHNHKYGILSVIKGFSKIEIIEQAKFKSRNGFSIDENKEGKEDEEEIKGISLEKLSQLILDLKIREAQLQIILIFEILSLLEINEEEFLERNKKVQKKLQKIKEKKAKQSLIGKNKRRKKKIQSDNGKENHQEEEEEKGTEEYSIFLSLNNLIDRLNLWDTLSTSTDGAGTYGFMAYVLVPYFNKKLPLLMKYVIENMKGSNMKLISSKRKKNEDHHTKVEAKKSKSNNISKSKFKKVLLDKNPPVLSKSDTIVDSDDFKPLISLKRSQSNLSTKMLSKREVDLNVKTNKLESSISETNSNQSFIFRSKLKRSKSTITTVTAAPNKPKFRKSLSQVEATPVKTRVLNFSQTQVQATPARSSSFSSSGNIFNTNNQLPQIEATPNSSIFSPIITTPIDKFIKPDKKQNSINDKLLSASKEMTVIEATPLKSTTDLSKTIIEATPDYAIISSPLKHHGSGGGGNSQGRPKPGEPVPLETSPLLNVLKDSESLLHKMKPINLFNDQDQDYDSDELLNPNKRHINNTYSRKRH